MKALSKFHVKEYTHILKCRHCMGNNCRTYYMPCIKIKDMPDGERVKIVVFGDRDWSNTWDKKRVRYVNKRKIRKKEKYNTKKWNKKIEERY